MAVNIRVDEELCIGCGMCTGIAPEAFQMNQNGKAGVIAGGAVKDGGAVQEAIDACPTSAISQEE